MFSENMSLFMDKVIIQMRSKDRSAFSTEEERSKYLSKLNNEFKKHYFESFYFSCLDQLKKRIAELNPISKDYAFVEWASFLLETYKRKGRGYDIYLFNEEIESGNWNDEELVDLFEGVFRTFIYRMGNISHLKNDLVNKDVSKWTAEESKTVREMLKDDGTFFEISEELNKDVVDIINHLSSKKSLLNYELVQYLTIYETAIDNQELYRKVYEEYDVDGEYLDLLSI